MVCMAMCLCLCCEDGGRCNKDGQSVGKEEEGSCEQKDNFCSKIYLRWKAEGKLRISFSWRADVTTPSFKLPYTTLKLDKEVPFLGNWVVAGYYF